MMYRKTLICVASEFVCPFQRRWREVCASSASTCTAASTIATGIDKARTPAILCRAMPGIDLESCEQLELDDVIIL